MRIQCCTGGSGGYRSVSYNPAENAVLLTTDQEGGSYELFTIPKDANGSSVVRAPSLSHSLKPVQQKHRLSCCCESLLLQTPCLKR